MSVKAKTQDASGAHITPVRTYFAVAGLLFLFTALTVTVSRIDFGAMNLVVAIGIATIKAVLVALFFMHLFHDNKLYASFFIGALIFLGTFVILTMYDTMLRGDLYQEVDKPIRARAEIYDDNGVPLLKDKMGAHEEGGGEEADGKQTAETGAKKADEPAGGGETPAAGQ